MWGVVHPFSKALYEQDGESTGIVKVTTTDGHVGRFHQDGSWIDGESFDVDPQLCNWVGGPRAKHRLSSEPKVS